MTTVLWYVHEDMLTRRTKTTDLLKDESLKNVFVTAFDDLSDSEQIYKLLNIWYDHSSPFFDITIAISSNKEPSNKFKAWLNKSINSELKIIKL